MVYWDCIRYGFDHIESLECAYTCNNLPKIVFKWDGIKSPKVPKYRGENAKS
jgi:hypothetical protein